MANNPTYQVTLSLEGLPSNGGEVRLGDLIYELQALNSLLLSLDRAVSPDHGVSTDYRVVDLRRVNPSQVTIGGTPKRGAPDVRSIVFGRPFEALSRLAAGETTGYDYDLLEDIKQLSAPVGKRLQKAALSWNGYGAELTPEIRETISKILEPHYVAAGFIQGRIEAANVHDGANTLKLYPRVGPNKVTGHFPSRLHEIVGRSLGRDVILHGIMKYRAGEPNAFAIDIESVEEFPDIQDLPTFYDIRGIMTDATDGLSSEEWLERNRKETEYELRLLLGR
jgi:hypothetical protein